MSPRKGRALHSGGSNASVTRSPELVSAFAGSQARPEDVLHAPGEVEEPLVADGTRPPVRPHREPRNGPGERTVSASADGIVRTYCCDICGRLDALVPHAERRLGAVADGDTGWLGAESGLIPHRVRQRPVAVR